MAESESKTAPVADPLGALERPPILVVGDEHFGATWVWEVLSAHPLVAGLSELLLFGSKGLEPLFRYHHWHPERSERMFERPMGLSQLLTRERVVADLRAQADRWLARALSPEHRFLVERSPIGEPGVRAFTELYPDGLVISVLRDGRAVAQSVIVERHHRWQTTDGTHAPPTPWRMMWSLGNSWAAYVKQLSELDRTLPSFHTLRYEDLLTRPRPSAREIFALCQIPCDEELLNRIVDQVGRPKPAPGRAWTRLERILYRAGAGEALHEARYSPAPTRGLRLLRQALLGYERLKRVI